uniref:Telomerase reverse transcriptase n=1 Tax=Toxocara canis TaxID=6265 RepID=A0A183U1U9_TOXCA
LFRGGFTRKNAIDGFRATFYVADQSQTNRLVFYRKDTWERIEEISFKQLEWKRQLRRIDGEEVDSACCAFLRFSPKDCRTRPLMIPAVRRSYKSRCVGAALKKVNHLFDFLCRFERRAKGAVPLTGAAIFGAYESFFRRFRKFAKRNASRKMFVVKTDIRDCFDCINQHKLSQVLASIIDSNRPYLFTAGRFKKNKEERKNNEGKRTKGKEKRGKETNQRTNALCREMALGLPIRSISYVPFPEHCTRVQIKGNEALEILEKAVIQQKILFRNRFYVAGRGIPQGSTVSTRLCDLYLGAVERERCADILKRRDCLLFRYVDDYILLTTDVRLADRFLKDLLCGVEDGYEMVADPSKTTINFVTDLHEFKVCVNVIDDDGFVTWCGYRIYPRELRVRQEP